MMLLLARVSACTNLANSVVIGVVEAVSVSGLSETGSRLHLLLLLVQQHLQGDLIITIELWLQMSSNI